MARKQTPSKAAAPAANAKRSGDAPDVYQRITDHIIAQLEKGARPWIKPWSAEAGGAFVLPRRASGEAYRGINVVLLWIEAEMKGYRNPTWMTFKQALDKGACVRKGETGAFICYASTFVKKEQDDTGREVERKVPFLKGYTVFNVEQIDGLPEGFGFPATPAAPAAALDEAARVAALDAFYGSLGMSLAHGGGRAFYSPAQDRVQMPPFSSFVTPVRYYDTLGHETIHWSGAVHRLDRNQAGAFGSPEYAREELVAEMGAAFLAALLGYAAEPRPDHADYIANWLAALRNDKRFVVQAASAAQKAVDFVLALGAAAEAPAAEEMELAA